MWNKIFICSIIVFLLLSNVSLIHSQSVVEDYTVCRSDLVMFFQGDDKLIKTDDGKFVSRIILPTSSSYVTIGQDTFMRVDTSLICDFDNRCKGEIYIVRFDANMDIERYWTITNEEDDLGITMSYLSYHNGRYIARVSNIWREDRPTYTIRIEDQEIELKAREDASNVFLVLDEDMNYISQFTSNIISWLPEFEVHGDHIYFRALGVSEAIEFNDASYGEEDIPYNSVVFGSYNFMTDELVWYHHVSHPILEQDIRDMAVDHNGNCIFLIRYNGFAEFLDYSFAGSGHGTNTNNLLLGSISPEGDLNYVHDLGDYNGWIGTSELAVMDNNDVVWTMNTTVDTFYMGDFEYFHSREDDGVYYAAHGRLDQEGEVQWIKPVATAEGESYLIGTGKNRNGYNSIWTNLKFSQVSSIDIGGVRVDLDNDGELGYYELLVKLSVEGEVLGYYFLNRENDGNKFWLESYQQTQEDKLFIAGTIGNDGTHLLDEELEGLGEVSVIFATLQDTFSLVSSHIAELDLLDSDSGIELYPNPVSEILYISELSEAPTGRQVMIYDMQGRLLYDQRIRDGGVVRPIETSFLVPGSYVLSIRYASGQLGHRIFVKE